MEYRGHSRSFTNRRQQHGHGGGQRNPTPSSHTTHALSFCNNVKTVLYVGKLGALRFETLSSIIGRFGSSSLAFLFFPLSSASRRSLTFRRLLKQFDRNFFVVRRIHALLIALIFFKIFLSLIRRICSRKKRKEEKCLKALLSSAVDYGTWANAAAKLDSLEGKCLPRWVVTRGTFGLSERAASLRQARESGDIASIAYTLRQDSTRRIGSLMATGAEESKCRILLPPSIVDDYIEEVKNSLHYICTDDTLSYDEKLSFTGELRHAYGRTGLVLSGGGSFGFFHFGVIRALFDAGLLPRVISGSSAGSIGAALLCTRSDAELKDYLDSFVDIGSLDFYGAPKSFFGYLRHLATKGALHTAEEYIERLKRLLGVETTFSEAFARSGRVLNVAVVAADTREPSRLLNYLTAPNVIIWSAVACSSAFPMLFEPQNLLCKDSSGRIVQLHASDATGLSGKMRRWCDGSLEEDLPMRGLSEMFSVNFFLCSQTNPWLVPILNAQSYLSPWMRRTIEFEVKHRLHQLLHVWRNSRVLKLLAQPWRGDLNFVLPAHLFQPLKSATNFSPSEINIAMKEGMRSVWSKLAAVRAACAIEYLIDAELQLLAKRARREHRKRTIVSKSSRRGIPSWMDLKSLGLPSLGSQEELLSLSSPGNSSLNSIQEHFGARNEAQESMDGQIEQVAPENGINSQSIESGIAAWRDVTALSMQSQGIDIVAP